MTLLRNGRLVTNPDVAADVRFADGRITEIGNISHLHANDDEETVDVGGAILAPGLIDLQCNGALGIDLASSPEKMWELSAQLPRWGVTAWAPTIISSSPSIVGRAIDTVLTGQPSQQPPGSATVLGLHLEGPCLSPAKAGAHARHLIRLPAETDTARWTPEAVALVTVAPEVDGALALITQLHRRGVVVSLGHSGATADETAGGIRAGATMATHLFNAMSPLHHRQPGMVGTVLADDHLYASLICDGVHVDPAMVAIAWKLLGARLVLVSDAVAALGLTPGQVQLGTVLATVTDNDVRLADGTLAGSNLSLDAAVRNLMAFTGCSVTEAVAAASATPAAVLGRTDIGALQVGASADLVVLDDGHVTATYVKGVRWKEPERSAAGQSWGQA